MCHLICQDFGYCGTGKSRLKPFFFIKKPVFNLFSTQNTFGTVINLSMTSKNQKIIPNQYETKNQTERKYVFS
jgi:hypothetical protein